MSALVDEAGDVLASSSRARTFSGSTARMVFTLQLIQAVRRLSQALCFFSAHPRLPARDVERIALRDFSSESSQALQILHEYGRENWHREADRVRLAALKLAAGNIDRLRSEIETAKCDYRDVLAPAEYPEYSRLVGPSETLSPSERERIIDADWQQYSE